MIEEALEFARKLREKQPPEVLSAVLFGSLARGEATRVSDIDIAIIYSQKDRKMVETLESMTGERIQLTHLSLEELKDEPTVAGVLSGEGELLYGRPVSLNAEDIELEPMMVVAYDTSGLNSNNRSRLHRALYGGVSTYYTRNGQKVVKEYPGVVEEMGAERLGKGVLMVKRRKYPQVLGALKAYGAEYREIPVWTY